MRMFMCVMGSMGGWRGIRGGVVWIGEGISGALDDYPGFWRPSINVLCVYMYKRMHFHVQTNDVLAGGSLCVLSIRAS